MLRYRDYCHLALEGLLLHLHVAIGVAVLTYRLHPYLQLYHLIACLLGQCYNWQHPVMSLHLCAHLDCVLPYSAIATPCVCGYGEQASCQYAVTHNL